MGFAFLFLWFFSTISFAESTHLGGIIAASSMGIFRAHDVDEKDFRPVVKLINQKGFPQFEGSTGYVIGSCVITAAHSVIEHQESLVFIGKNPQSPSAGGFRQIKLGAGDQASADIAIIKLEGELGELPPGFSGKRSDLAAEPMPEASDEKPIDVNIVGYGLRKAPGETETEKCKGGGIAKYVGSGKLQNDSSTTLWTIPGPQSAQKGDSGGPLFYGGKIYGFASRSFTREKSGVPTVAYAPVYENLELINKALDELGCGGGESVHPKAKTSKVEVAFPMPKIARDKISPEPPRPIIEKLADLEGELRSLDRRTADIERSLSEKVSDAFKANGKLNANAGAIAKLQKDYLFDREKLVNGYFVSSRAEKIKSLDEKYAKGRADLMRENSVIQEEIRSAENVGGFNRKVLLEYREERVELERKIKKMKEYAAGENR
jgi:hypothetical protein